MMRTLPYVPDIHERTILRHFGEERVKVGRRDPRFDGVRTYILCFSNRSGSNVLAECISKDARYGRARECLNGDEVVRVAEARKIGSFSDYLYSVVQTDMGTGRIFGLKASWQQLAFLITSGVMENCLHGAKVVHIRRRDVIGQAISLSIAKQTEQWASFLDSVGDKVEYRESEILEFVQAACNSNAMFDALFELHGMNPIRVVYEDLVRDFVGTTHEVWRGLNFFADVCEFDSDDIEMKRQSGSLNDVFRAKLLEAYALPA